MFDIRIKLEKGQIEVACYQRIPTMAEVKSVQ